MSDLKILQLEYEADTWKRLLRFMIDENIHLKNRLSEIIQYIPDVSSLEELENFQNRFIRKDEIIGLLRNELAELDNLLERETFEDGKIVPEIDKKIVKLRNNIINAETQFSKLKIDFNNFLSMMLDESSSRVLQAKN